MAKFKEKFAIKAAFKNNITISGLEQITFYLIQLWYFNVFQ